jgi:hypothetical protein
MKDVQKAHSTQKAVEEEGKVYIPENIEESDSESDSFGERLRRLNEGQSSKQSDKQEHLWMKEVNASNPISYDKGVVGTVKDMSVDGLPPILSARKMIESPELFITEDNIIHTQESQALNDEVPMANEAPEEMQAHEDGDDHMEEDVQAIPPQRGVKGSRKISPSLPKRRLRRWPRRGTLKVPALIRICFLFCMLMR